MYVIFYSLQLLFDFFCSLCLPLSATDVVCLNGTCTEALYIAQNRAIYVSEAEPLPKLNTKQSVL